MKGHIINKNRPEVDSVTVENGETSSIAAGTPVCYVMSGTNDGVRVVLPATATAAKAHTLFAGILSQDLGSYEYGHAQVFGLCVRTKIIRALRAASTDSWSASAVSDIGTLGDYLVVNTVHNAMQRTGAGGTNAAAYLAVLAETIASVAASASTTSDTRIALTTTCKTFLRVM